MSAGRISKALIVAAIGMFMGMAVLTGAAGAQLKNAPATTDPATFTARGSIEELYVTDAEPGESLMLVNSDDKIVRNAVADSFGSKIFYFLDPGAEYTVRLKKAGKVYGTPKVRVRKADANPKQSFYDSIGLQKGLNYVKMRDGVELAMTVRLPGGKTLADGPFPTFIEYSGYQVAAPNSLIDAVLGGGPPDPLAPASSTAVGSLIGPLLDFAVVSVQMRGSGCSGGGFDLFGLPTTYDGYDAVEAVAAQDWVKGGKVGMGGISFSGITQLFTAGTQPPHLAAISPLSVTDDVYLATGYPGGIFNSGFAFSWITERANNAEPGPAGGQPYSRILSDPASPFYDPKCAANQRLRLQTRNYNQLIENNQYRTPSLFGVRSPGAWMSRIKVPTFLVGAFQDEQTGGHFVESLGKLKNNKNVWISLQNGVHSDSLGPSTITRWVEFLNLFVADRIPKVPPLILALGGDLYDFLANAPALPVEQSRFASYTSLEKAKADFRKDPRVRLMMDNGAAIPASPGAIGASWELGFDSWPIRQVRPVSYFIDANGKLRPSKPRKASRAAYVGDPDARPEQTITDGSEWAAQPNYNWTPLVGGKGLGFTSAPLAKDMVIAGPSSMDLYLKSSARDTDLQVTLTEVRPDGKETLVQSGWLRASHRKLGRGSTALDPKPTHLKRDARNLTRGKFTLVRVPIFPVAHAFRKGSKIRVNIQAPGGDRQIWKFDTIEDGSTRNVIAGGVGFASKLVLPVIPGVKAKKPLPVPTALRGQPSRDYVPASNGG